MKKIIILVACLFFCSISINAGTIFQYKNKDNTSPIKKYKVKHRFIGQPRSPVYTLSFSLDGKLVDKEGNPLANKSIEIYSLNSFLYSRSSFINNRYGNKFVIQTNSKGFFSKTFDIDAYINLQGKDPSIEQIQAGAEIHFVFYSDWDTYYNGIDYMNKHGRYYSENTLNNLFGENTIKYKLINGQNLYSVPNPVRIIYKYPFDKFIKIIPYDKNDNAQLIKAEESKSNVIVLDTIDLSAEYFRKKQDIIDEAKKMLNQEDIYTNVDNLILENNSIKDNWKEIIELKIKEVKEERKQKEIEKQQKEQQKKKEIEAFKHDPNLHTVKSQIGRCPNCYRFTLGISLFMRTGDPYHHWLMMFCPECSYHRDEFSGF